MFDRPQYLTPQGYKRKSRNPIKKKNTPAIPAQKKSKALSELHPLLKKKSQKP